MTDSPADLLAALRVDIDRIDAAMHELLIERGGIIDRLIAVKARQGGGSAFRPDREAAMMRRLVERHRGALPLDTVEGIWRVIIATFTFVQAGYAVHADTSANGDAVRDSARFHFGFTVPLVRHGNGRPGFPSAGAHAVIQAVAAAEGDLGLVPVDARPSGAPWWHRLGSDDAPKVIARLPFVERADHPAGLPVFIIARPGAATPVRDVVLYAVSAVIDDPDEADAPPWRGFPDFDALGAIVLGSGGNEVGQARLVSVDGSAAERFAERLAAHDPHLTVREVGSHAARFSLPTA